MSIRAEPTSSAKHSPRSPIRVEEGTAEPMNYVMLYKSTPLDRIGIVKRGLPASHAKQIVADLKMPMSSALQALHVSTSTINRKARNQELLTQDESERFVGLAKMIGQVQAMVEDSGDPKGFDAPAWTAGWLNEPLPAFAGARPIDLMDTMEGQALVSDTLARIGSGAYA